jgi:hypothetical protein
LDGVSDSPHKTYTAILFPNQWREKAQGRIIHHVPITLYADDTSGNQSKQWNKHISFYFTLAGLHPKFTNQEYHCHFLGTTNVAGVLELAEPIIKELKLVTDSFLGY